MIKHLIGKKVDLKKPPSFVTEVTSDPACSENYRPSPFIIQAACHGNLEIFKILSLKLFQDFDLLFKLVGTITSELL